MSKITLALRELDDAADVLAETVRRNTCRTIRENALSKYDVAKEKVEALSSELTK